jgi:tetratricopeptide (TPR) repeat protein
MPGMAAAGVALFALFMMIRTPETAPVPVSEPQRAEVATPKAEAPLSSPAQPPAAPMSTLPPTMPVDLTQAVEAKFNEGVMLAQAGEYEKSIPIFEEVRRLNPAAVEPLTNIGRAYVQLGRFDDAVRTYQEGVRLNPNDADMIDMLGVAYGYKGDVDGALAQFQRAILLDPYLASAYSNAGLALMKKSDAPGATKMLKKAIELDPTMTRAYGNLVGLYLESGMLDEIEPLMQKLQAANPSDPMALAMIKELRGALAGSGSSTPTPGQD